MPVGFGRKRLPLRRRFLFEWLVFVFVVILMGGYIGLILYADYNRVDREERNRLSALASVIDQNLVQQFVMIDRSLAALRDDPPLLMARSDGKMLVDRRLQALCDAIPGVRTIMAIDAGGLAYAGNREVLVGLNFQDGPVFKRTRAGGDPNVLYVSQPYITPLGIQAIAVSKAMVDEQGRFAGMIMAVLAPDYFRTLLSSVRYAPDMVSTVIHGEGPIIVRIPDKDAVVGMDLAQRPGAFLPRHLKSGNPTDVYVGNVASTDDRRLLVLHTAQPVGLVLDVPLVISLSRRLDEFFAPWWSNAEKQVVMFSALVFTAFVALFTLQRRSRTIETMTNRHLASLVAETEKAVAANEAKSRFLAAVSHDLRQPLQALSLYQSVLAGHATKQDTPVLLHIDHCISSLNEMLGSLLDLSRLEAGVVTPNVVPFVVADLLDKIASHLAPEAQKKGLDLRIGPAAVRARTDPVLLERILANLVVNAIRYTETGGVLIGCRRKGGKLWVEVWDTGIGIPEDKIDEVFEEFRQLDNPERDRDKGVGLGLSIVKKMADLLGLEIRVESRPRHGSMFAVELPQAMDTPTNESERSDA